MRWIGYMTAILWWSGIARTLSSMNRGYKISPKPCRVVGQPNVEGTCMFVWECIKSEGTHVGVCVDSFMFGSCCVHNATQNSIAIAAAAAAGQHYATKSTSHNNSTSNQAPTTRRPSSSQNNQHQMASRPLQKKPHSKPVDNGGNNNGTRNNRPGNAISYHHYQRPDQEDRQQHHLAHHGNGQYYHHQHHHHHHYHQQSSFKDKVSGGGQHNTLLVRLPNNKNQASNGKNQRPGVRPYNTRPDDRDQDDQDLSVQESVQRPSINSLDDDEAMNKLNKPSMNHIYTERPQWATKPSQQQHQQQSYSRPSDYSKPHFSAKTSSTTSTSSTTTTTTTTTRRPIDHATTKVTATSHYSAHSTSVTAVPQTAHWQLTTEPAFVTRNKPAAPSSSSSSSASSSWSSSSSSSMAKPQPQHHKPHWSSPSASSSTSFDAQPQRPSYKPENHENHVYQKPHSAHYITTSYLDSPTKARPTKKTPQAAATTTAATTMTSSPTSSTSSASYLENATTSTSTTTATPTIIKTSFPESSTTTTTTTTTGSPLRTGSVLTIPAASEKSGMSCGLPSLFPRPETRIVGGKEAPFGKWPWQVSVRRTSFFGFSSTHRCGGAVLNENWIATAGHCVDDLLTSQIRIRVGEYDFSSVQERLPYVERGITKKVVHPKYNFFTFEYDLALVRLETPLVFAPHISPICLPAADELLIGENATVTGWGRLSEGGTLPSVLQEVSVPIVSNDKCKSMFLKAGRHEFIPEIFLCAGYEVGGQDSCQGDSGGPLQVRGKDGRYFLAGIISWGIGCAEANLPGVCTRISKFVPWIIKNVS
ncbi:hypothetical protein TKK_0014142 [Trichogramma kaykai]|uniref:Peptidase S1 domain-containing protein n=1 Tax=Trichogramma kaykai TaxID=54128 RepID=A0ABD2WER1_9HYME